MYRLLIRRMLFSFSPETAHHITFRLLQFLRYIPLSQSLIRAIFRVRDKEGELRREVFGLTFRNPVGLAAGLDKNGEFYNDMGNFGFSFVEIGSLTPEPQPGNPKPRSFRLVEDHALINRMGINNKGVKYAVAQLQKRVPNVIIGGNIAKASKTPNEDAYKDYERSFSHLLTLRRYYDDYRPILLKISPDIPYEHVDRIVDLALSSGLDGIIATNTTNSREGLSTDPEKVKAIGNGGLSGQPLYEKSLAMVRHIHQKTGGILPIIGVGGIMTPEQAKEMLDAGASLIQIYSGFIYNGPGAVRKILKYLKSHK